MEVTTVDWIIAIVAIGGILLNMTIAVLSRRGQLAKANADNAGAYESLSETVTNLARQVRELRVELDVERRAREIAEQKVAALQRKIEELEFKYRRDVTRLKLENSALKEAFEVQDNEEQ
jgi:outer membrane protein TolC